MYFERKPKIYLILKKVLDYVLSLVFLLLFGLILCIFHPIQYIVYNLFGQDAHQKTVEWLNFCLLADMWLIGSTTSFTQKTALPTDRSILFVANHRSMFDIPGLIWYLRKHTPLFVSKKELAKGIPSISYNLRVGKAALIDRKDGKQAVVEIAKLGKYITEKGISAAIFPEGTRAKTDILKPFAVGGLAILMKKCPDAVVVPVAITNTGHFNPQGIFPMRSFTPMSWNTLEPIEFKGKSAEAVVAECENQIKAFLGQNG